MNTLPVVKHLLDTKGDIRTTIAEQPTATEKGAVLAHLVAALFSNQHESAMYVDGAGDGGVDVVVEHVSSNTRTAIQVKAYSAPLTPDDLHLIVAKVDAQGHKQHNTDRLIVVALNGYNKTVESQRGVWTSLGQEITLLDGDQLQTMLNLHDAVQRSVIDLKPHNRAVVMQALPYLRDGKSVLITQATGVGKRYVTAALVEHLKGSDYTIVGAVLAPTQVVLDQHESLINTTATGLNYISYAGVASKNKRGELPANLSVIVEDETHRSLATGWSEGVAALRKTNPKAVVIGTTATEVRMDSRSAVNNYDVHIRGLNLADAITSGILPEPTYILGASELAPALAENLAEVDETAFPEAQQQRIREAREFYSENPYGDLLSAMEKIVEGRKGTTCHLFTESIAQAHEIHNYLANSTIGKNLNMVRTHSYADDATNIGLVTPAEAVERINKAKNYRNRVTVCISVGMFNEGLHTDTPAPTVVMYRPTSSHIIALQQMGRALDSGKATHPPLIVDLVGNMAAGKVFDLRGAVEASARSKEDTYAKLGLGKRVWKSKSRPVVHTETLTGLEVAQRASEATELHNVWAQVLEIAKYREVNGRLPLTSDGGNGTLAAQLDDAKYRIREAYYRGDRKLPRYIKDTLESIPDMLEYLNKPKVNNHAHISYSDRCNLINQFAIENGRQLDREESIDSWNAGRWVDEQRKGYKAGTLSQEQIALCESVSGWYWAADPNKVMSSTKVTCSCCSQVMNLQSYLGHTTNQRKEGIPAVASKLPMNQQPDLLDYYESIAVKKGFYSQWKEENCHG
ncbi:restriction endonuclease [Polynucleobacter sp. es-MAR-4]|uniref:restriction endonuclease n=1 Tax=Polynucleobacter sp. es-MAR-4 TaxID=1855655 RepID=UPI001C0C1DF3|nr:restriction endonuclease [Polynucleobacter sp. es-MAR-4]MBU3637355.1 restriction endonuclease [Polynucleobacter sp. es-MAR-4]